MSSKSKGTKKTAVTRPRTTAAPPDAPEDEAAEEQLPLPSSEGGIDMNRFVAKYEARVGKLTTENILLEEQLEGTKAELTQMRAALDDLVSRLPKSESADASRPATPAKKTAAPKK